MGQMKYFCFRFDVDTLRCMKRGVPNLLALSKRLHVPFTFFVNMGRGTSRRLYLKKLFASRNGTGPTTAKLSNLQKLGWKDFLITALWNPKVGASCPHTLKALAESGNELGLHGGFNHGAWQHDGAGWPVEKIRREVSGALRTLTRHRIAAPAGFASPGWQGSAALNRVLPTLGFHYVADRKGSQWEAMTPAGSPEKLWQVPTNILGEPGGVGYVEHLRAEGKDDAAILDDFAGRLADKNIAVVYEHPGYAGVQELPLIEAMIVKAQSLGFTVTTLKDIVRRSA